MLVEQIDIQRIQSTFRSRRWEFDIPAGAAHASTCVEELMQRLPHLSPESWPERFALGGVYLNGREAAADFPISPPCRLEYFEPLTDLTNVRTLYPAFSSDTVVWRDEDLAIVVKPAGLPTTAPRDQRRFTLEAYLTEYFGSPLHLPSRLDTDVSGLLIASLSKRMHGALQRAYDRRAVEKYYLAEVVGDFPHAEIDIRSPLGRDPRHPVLRQVVESGGDTAHTRVCTLGRYQRGGTSYSLLQAQPLTGRTHQIRVHLASLGFPIVGDVYYGGVEAPHIHLLSYALFFHHPYAQKQLSLYLPLARRPGWLQSSELSQFPSEIIRSEARKDESYRDR